MPKLNPQTKEKILSAAEIVFHENGLKGARTTSIAQKAGVSRTMLHYYYRTKEELFYEVLESSFGFFLNKARKLFQAEEGLKATIEQIVDLLYDVLTEKPGLSTFIVNILSESPELIINLPPFQEEQIPTRFDKLLDEARQSGEIQADISGENLLLNIYGLCAVPYMVTPLIKFKESRTEAEMNTFLNDRKRVVKAFIWNGIQY
ncbi:MAG: TetR/AcrR family transcriptional regulator [Bacteroidota bacterium]